MVCRVLWPIPVFEMSDWHPFVMLVVIALIVALLQGLARHIPCSHVFKDGTTEAFAGSVRMAASPGTLRQELASELLETLRRADWHVLDRPVLPSGSLMLKAAAAPTPARRRAEYLMEPILSCKRKQKGG